jgi:hypothetical protein
MARYTVTHNCGHPSVEHLSGPHDQRERKIAWLSGQMCPECLQIERAKVAAHMHDHDTAMGLPPLEGTDKQITWAAQIRHCAFAEIEKLDRELKDRVICDGEGAALAEQLLFELDSIVLPWKQQKYAHWWIEHRSDVEIDAVRRKLQHIAHELGDVMRDLQISNIGIGLSDQRDIIRMAVQQRAEALERRRQEEIERKRLMLTAEQQADLDRTRTEAERQQKAWAQRDEIAKAIAEAMPGLACSITVWMPRTEKRVYMDLDAGRRKGVKACLYITGNAYNRPGAFTIDTPHPKIDPGKLKAALQLAADRYNRLQMRVTEDGTAA